MSCIAQTLDSKEAYDFDKGALSGRWQCHQFRDYAAEALLWVGQSETEEEKQLLLDLVRTWTKAAVVSESRSCRRRRSAERGDVAQQLGARLRRAQLVFQLGAIPHKYCTFSCRRP